MKYIQAHGGQVTLEEVKGQSLGGHFHGHTIGILSLIEYAMAAGDRELLEWCTSSYEWAKTQGSSLVGFFPGVYASGLSKLSRVAKWRTWWASRRN